MNNSARLRYAGTHPETIANTAARALTRYTAHLKEWEIGFLTKLAKQRWPATSPQLETLDLLIQAMEERLLPKKKRKREQRCACGAHKLKHQDDVYDDYGDGTRLHYGSRCLALTHGKYEEIPTGLQPDIIDDSPRRRPA